MRLNIYLQVYSLFEEAIPTCYAEWAGGVNDEAPYGMETETAYVQQLSLLLSKALIVCVIFL